MILSCQDMKDVETRAFASGVEAETLMDEAGKGIADAILELFPSSGSVIIYAGKGNNAGDAFVAAQHLFEAGWTVYLRAAFPDAELSPLGLKKLLGIRRFLIEINDESQLPTSPTVLLDGLVGLGSRGAIHSPLNELIIEMNWLRYACHARVVAIDLPSGIDGDTGVVQENCVQADVTVTIGFPKLGLIADGAVEHVGRIVVVPLLELLPPVGIGHDADYLGTAASLRRLVAPRHRESHKTHYGRIGVLAGSPGFCGAAVLTAAAALRAGGGLVTLYATPDTYSILSVTAPSEVMVKPVGDFRAALEDELDMMIVGPGVGLGRPHELIPVMETFTGPMVIDADGLNILAQHRASLSCFNGPRLLTPHPGEMRRLCDWQDEIRLEVAGEFVAEYPVALLLKGARSLIAQFDKPVCYNTTGNPGMATAGMGDILAGVCGGLVGQGLSPYDAGCVGAWLCGRAAELAVATGGESEESLVASDLLATLGRAFGSLRAGQL